MEFRFYNIVKENKRWTESFNIITVTHVNFTLEDDKTKEIMDKTVIFNQLVDLRDALREKRIMLRG